MEKVLNTVGSIGQFSGLELNIRKTKAMWLGKWASHKSKPMRMKWVNGSTKFLRIYLSYDEKGNNHSNFNVRTSQITNELGYMVFQGSNTIWVSLNH